MKISRFFFTKGYASTVDHQFCHSSRRIDCQFGECCLKPFPNCVVIEKKIQRVCLPPQEDAIFVGTQWSHMLERLDFAIAWPSLGLIRSLATKASEEDGFPEIRHCCTFYRFFVQCPIKMKDFYRKLPSRRRHLSLARADIVRHKSGISLSSRVWQCPIEKWMLK